MGWALVELLAPLDKGLGLMRVNVLTVVKDEVDIVGLWLDATVRWAHRIFVLDNGSTDGTYELLQDRANRQVILVDRYEGPFTAALRGELYRSVRQYAQEGDWWCSRGDVDEFYLEDPRLFLSRVKRPFSAVDKGSVDYVVSREDLRDFDFAGSVSRDAGKLRYIKPRKHVELRFFRERSAVEWPEGAPGARHVGPIWPRKIPAAHYQVRSPMQARVRFESLRRRRPDKERRSRERLGSWEDLLRPRRELVLDGGPETWKRLPHQSRSKSSIWRVSRSVLVEAVRPIRTGWTRG